MLDGDTATLCSAACVSTVWRDAAKEAYTKISVGTLRQGHGRWEPSPLALRMNGHVLSRLVNLAGASLTHLNISGAVHLVSRDLLVLRLPACPSLKKVSMVSNRGLSFQITGSGVLAALGGRKLRCLEVLGIDGLSHHIEKLRAIVRKTQQLDVDMWCENCGRLVKQDMMHESYTECMFSECGGHICGGTCHDEYHYEGWRCDFCDLEYHPDEEEEEWQ
jgi:hypothetical protein